VINYPLHTFNLNSINRYLLLLNAKYVEAVENALKYFNNVTYSVIYIELQTLVRVHILESDKAAQIQ